MSYPWIWIRPDPTSQEKCSPAWIIPDPSIIHFFMIFMIFIIDQQRNYFHFFIHFHCLKLKEIKILFSFCQCMNWELDAMKSTLWARINSNEHWKTVMILVHYKNYGKFLVSHKSSPQFLNNSYYLHRKRCYEWIWWKYVSNKEAQKKRNKLNIIKHKLVMSRELFV